MRVGDIVRYIAGGDKLGMGIVLMLPSAAERWRGARVMWSGEVRGMPIRWILLEYLEVIDASW